MPEPANQQALTTPKQNTTQRARARYQWNSDSAPRVNMHGRRSDVTRAIVQKLNELEKVKLDAEGKPIKDQARRKNIDAMVDSLFELAIERKDLSAIQEITNRVEGKVPQAIVGADQGPVQLQITSREQIVMAVLGRGIDVNSLPTPVTEDEAIDAEPIEVAVEVLPDERS